MVFLDKRNNGCQSIFKVAKISFLYFLVLFVYSLDTFLSALIIGIYKNFMQDLDSQVVYTVNTLVEWNIYSCTKWYI